MKITSTWLVLLCVILAISGCQSSVDEDTVNTSSEPETVFKEGCFYAPAPLTEALKEEIEAAWSKEYGVPFAELGSWCNMDEEADKDNAIRYYGRFEGYDVLFIQGPFFAISNENIAGFTFSHLQSFSIRVYHNGAFRYLKDAYQEGEISAEAIKEIYDLHSEFEQDVFGFNGEEYFDGRISYEE